VALRHYLEGRIGLEEIAEFVSRDLTGSEANAARLIPTVRAVLEDFTPVEVVS
jgi:hypothetical protein